MSICPKHPDYKAIRKPTSDCSACLAIWASVSATASHSLDLAPSTSEYLQKLWATAPADVVQTAGSMRLGNETKYVRATFPVEDFPEGIEILHLTDVQFGHVCCNVAKFIEYRDWVLAEPNRFVFFGGDMVDAATAISKGSPYENTEEPQGQVYRFVELAMPIRHRILGYVGGNHERRSALTFGDLGGLIATLLKVPYSRGKQYVDIQYGSLTHKNSLWHGGTGSKTKGAKAQMLHRYMQQGDSHVYWVGHLHDTLLLGDVRENRGKDGNIAIQKFYGVMSSSFLEHFGTYAEVAGLPAGDTQMWRLVIEPNCHWMLTIK